MLNALKRKLFYYPDGTLALIQRPLRDYATRNSKRYGTSVLWIAVSAGCLSDRDPRPGGDNGSHRQRSNRRKSESRVRHGLQAKVAMKETNLPHAARPTDLNELQLP
jgi:hypothetical protein